MTEPGREVGNWVVGELEGGKGIYLLPPSGSSDRRVGGGIRVYLPMPANLDQQLRCPIVSHASYQQYVVWLCDKMLSSERVNDGMRRYL